ncbi:hypothetical protein AAZX31_17G206300 [Glycine max]
MALDEILRCKMMAKLGASSQKGQLQYDGWSDANANANGLESQENEEITSAIPCDNIQSHGKPHTFSAQRSRRRRLDKNFTRHPNYQMTFFGDTHSMIYLLLLTIFKRKKLWLGALAMNVLNYHNISCRVFPSHHFHLILESKLLNFLHGWRKEAKTSQKWALILLKIYNVGTFFICLL